MKRNPAGRSFLAGKVGGLRERIRPVAFVAGALLSGLMGFGVGLLWVSAVAPVLVPSADDTPMRRSVVFMAYVLWGGVTLGGTAVSWHRTHRG